MENKESKKLTDKQTAFLAALFGEAAGNFSEAKRIAGYSDYTTTAEVINGLRDEILEHTNSFLAGHAPKAVMKLVGLLDNPNSGGAGNLLKTVETILNRVGISEKKSGEGVELKVPSGGLFILPAKEVQEFKKITEESDGV